MIDSVVVSAVASLLIADNGGVSSMIIYIS
jgi:hypothetical protein